MISLLYPSVPGGYRYTKSKTKAPIVPTYDFHRFGKRLFKSIYWILIGLGSMELIERLSGIILKFME